MTNDQLDEIIMELLHLGVEGEYWDFKEKPYFFEGQSDKDKNKKKGDLLHDIICMANNLSNRDAFIIMGIQDKPVKITGAKQFSNKWTQESYQDFLQNLTWAGDMIPIVEFRTIHNGELDVLIIKKSNRVPFYITKKCNKVRENQIYVRKGSKNTAIDSQAEIGDIEKLFEFRFGLTPYPKERVINYISDHGHWIEMKEDYETRSWYYEKFPEYTIELSRDPDNETLASPDYAYVQMNCKSSWQILRVKYHQTTLMEYTAHYVDETRGVVVAPRFSSIKIREDETLLSTKQYCYYFQECTEIKLMFLLQDLLRQGTLVLENHLALIPIYKNDEEKSKVENIINKNKEDFNFKMEHEILKSIISHGSELSEESEMIVRHDLAVTKVVKNILNEYRAKKVYEKTK
ncbi:RNA-binding domain-containing protein [Streptococcus salivarius]|uniref:RNA-binding domain-containing protein n=1 Tax=Streptococcus salivarius TaxID=1304 RepID=UPI001E379245|nr:RNA-binding domain-containing protein [Streptococcus salivarius]